MSHVLLSNLRNLDVARAIGPLPQDLGPDVLHEWFGAGVSFLSSSERLTARYWQAVRELFSCITPHAGNGGALLNEGGIYHGCWLESTGTINAEILSRFLPSVSTSTFSAFAAHQRDDGLLPYKITAQGAAFNQIQLVSPLARSAFNHYRLNGTAGTWLAQMYQAMARYDGWISTYRNTQGTGAVEAFSTFDTGHDLSPRFWHAPDSPFKNDPSRLDPDNPLLPYIAPDLTANIACQRQYLGLIAAELGQDGGPWQQKCDASLKALFAQCYDADDGNFYDRDRHGRLVRVQSDVLLRVLACEVGDGAQFAAALDRYLLNTGKFFAKFPLTSIALDDPRFDPNVSRNSWAGPTNFLTLIRAPHAFEHHGRHVELSWIMQPILAALFAMDRFPQTLDPFTGEPGFTEAYSPSILCLLDFIERMSGILPRPDGTVWFTSLLPKPVHHRHETWETGYARTIDGSRFELINSSEGGEIHRDGHLLSRFPAGVRITLDRRGGLRAATGLTSRNVTAEILHDGQRHAIALEPNSTITWDDDEMSSSRGPGLVLPRHG
ncbi:MGH1-like glycoside hydrolase domain-containing protein [Devosia chinhatensis]|uniref:Mannosylglycerate hydrolase MGH1-like glycoside hydrolase domain-containing protein n=1 Tax=Devosia chinhatensis TaxID=429727 RepID=A0A0F5FJE8_9HYPH|nr:hypothetical protein [Devosia chinhatensis]KKB08928.1 hypothetical protein VE26_02440 [Devosia chinhatensis]